MATSMGRLRTRMPKRENWTEYVQRVTAGVARKDVAQAAGIDASGISRWINSEQRPRAENVVAFARGLRQSPIEALIAAGYLEPHEASGVIEVMRSREELSDTELLIELGERLAERPTRTQVDDITGRLSRPDDVGERIQNDHGLL
jgi:transcriptional regulator with XRE-family HTH domain